MGARCPLPATGGAPAEAGGRRRKTASFRQTRFCAARAAPRWSAKCSERATCRHQVDPGRPRSRPGGPGS
eukprot:1479993-Pyramimonas_sp.AAC.1